MERDWKRPEEQRLRQWKKEKYPFLEESDPRLSMTDAEIIDKDIRLDAACLSPKAKERLMAIIHKNLDAFSLHSDVGSCDDSNIRFEVLKDEGLFIRPYKASPADRKILEEEVQKLVQMGVLRQARSQYLSPLLLVRNKTSGKTRIVTDFRKINKLIKPEHVPSAVTKDAFNQIGYSGAQVYFYF